MLGVVGYICALLNAWLSKVVLRQMLEVIQQMGGFEPSTAFKLTKELIEVRPCIVSGKLVKGPMDSAQASGAALGCSNKSGPRLFGFG